MDSAARIAWCPRKAEPTRHRVLQPGVQQATLEFTAYTAAVRVAPLIASKAEEEVAVPVETALAPPLVRFGVARVTVAKFQAIKLKLAYRAIKAAGAALSAVAATAAMLAPKPAATAAAMVVVEVPAPVKISPKVATRVQVATGHLV